MVVSEMLLSRTEQRFRREHCWVEAWAFEHALVKLAVTNGLGLFQGGSQVNVTSKKMACDLFTCAPDYECRLLLILVT